MKIRLEDGTGLDLKYLVKDTDRHGNERIYVRRHGRKVRIRALGAVEEFMAAYRAALSEWDRPYASSKAFGNRFKSWCRQAGLPHCTAHGLRKAGATIAAENGATEHQLMAMFGWDSPQQAALYTRKANRKRLATEAMHKLMPGQTENKSVPPEGAVASGGTMRGKKS